MTDFKTLKPDPDVLIIGAGSAGVAAAVAAARNNASVVILEKNDFPGGKATASYVGTVCGLYYRSEHRELKYAHSGFPKEFAESLSRLPAGEAVMSQSEVINYKNGLKFLPYDDTAFKNLCLGYLEKSGVNYFFNSEVSGALLSENRILSVQAIINGEEKTIKPKTVIDASGINLVASMTRLDSITSDRYQAAAQVFGLSGLDTNDTTTISLNLIRSVQKAIGSGVLENYFGFISVVPGSAKNGNVLLKLPLPDVIENDREQQERLNYIASNAVKKLTGYLRKQTDIFKNTELTFIAPEVGIRTGPRNFGKTVLKGDDVLNAVKCNNAIARGAWPVEYWEPGKPVRMEFFAMEDHYDIPASALQSDQVENLYFAGRNISADDTAIASARVIGTCLATGFAAGVLAAIKAKNKSVEEAVSIIQGDLFATPVAQ